MKSFKNTFSKRQTAVILIIVAVALIGASIPTAAWFTKTMTPVVNTFSKAFVAGKTENTADGVIFTNTSNIDAYLRVTLTPVYYNADGTVNAGVTAEKQASYLSKLALPANWVKGSDGYYYYKKPVKAGESLAAIKYPAADTVSGLSFKLECNGELIQCEPSSGVSEAWGVTVSGTTLIPG